MHVVCSAFFVIVVAFQKLRSLFGLIENEKFLCKCYLIIYGLYCIERNIRIMNISQYVYS